MIRKLLLTTIILFCISFISFAQNSKKTAILRGRLINGATKAPLSDKKVLLQGLDVFATTDGEGVYEFSEVPYGLQTILVIGNSVASDTLSVMVDRDIVEAADMVITPNDNNPTVESVEIPTIAIEENSSSSEDDGVTTQNSSGLMVASRDPFVYAASFVFGAYYFQPRGAKRNAQEIQVNGIPINDIETGNASWNQFGGLNDVFRSRNFIYGLSPSNYTFGGLGGSTYFEATAADQRKETQVTYSASNRNYHNRVMLTHNSGLMSNGWAYSVSMSYRWAEQGYVPGTFYDGKAYYAAVSKVIGKGQLNLTTFGAPTIHGKAGTATSEVYALDNSHYFNHDWGYQNGQVRNSVVQNTFQPTTILNYEYRPSEKTRWNTAVAYQFGKDMTSGINSYNGSPSIFGDYYRNLPSFYLNSVPPDPATAAAVKSQIMKNPNQLQINWDNLYQSNYTDSSTIYNVGGIAGNNVTGRRSVYVLSNKVNDLNKYTFNTNIEHTINSHLTLYGGITFIYQKTESYNLVSDLLGGDFFVDYNQYAPTTNVTNPNYNYNNVLNPNAVIKVGDKWNYDYAMRLSNSLLWGQAVYNLNKFDFFLAVNGGDYSFSREGYFKNGLFMNNSYGVSADHSFITYAIKGGIDYKINARNILFLNAAYEGVPPTSDNTYISVSTRDYTVNNPSLQINKSLEGGYFLKKSDLSIRIDGYVTDETNITSIKRFFNDDPAYYTFVNYVMQGANTRSIGTEIAVNYKLFRSFSISGVASIGQAFYTNEPNVSIYLDNDTTLHANPSKVYIKNYYLSAGPQSAYTIGLNYRPKNWYCSMNFNYLDRNYVDINPNRRTQEAAGFNSTNTPQWHQIFDQEELPAVFTVDLHAGTNIQLSRMNKTINKISKNTSLNINLGVNNLLNNTNIINFGYEQLRYDYYNANPAKFPNKYVYGMGINFLLNVVLRF